MAAYGLKPVRMRSGRPFHGSSRAYYVPSSYNTALFVGDPVIKTGDMNTAVVNVGGQSHDIGTLQTVNLATASDANPITGVIVAISPINSDLNKQYKPASTECVVHVVDDPDVVFQIQADSALTAAASVGLNAVLIAATSGSTVTGLSGMALDSGTSDGPAVDASNQLLILNAVKRATLDFTGTPDFEVLIINHTEAQSNLGVGIS